MNPIARWIEWIVFSSRWLVVPFLFGLIVGPCCPDLQIRREARRIRAPRPSRRFNRDAVTALGMLEKMAI
jgi:hypothetical protein